MKVTNVSVTRERGIVTATSNVHGYTFTHSPGCGILHAAEYGAADDHRPWGDRCDCFLSRVEITAINGVPVVTDPSLLNDEQLRTKFWHKEYLDLRRRFTYMSAVAVAGWLYGLARGIWGF
jgi:hypothetical protein